MLIQTRKLRCSSQTARDSQVLQAQVWYTGSQFQTWTKA